MKNKEKSFDKICEIAYNGGGLAVTKNGEAVQCSHITCKKCIFGYSRGDCAIKAREWLESEYIEKPVISKRDAMFLEYLKEENKYIARDENGGLFIYNEEPYKDGVHWTLGDSIGDWFRLNRRFNIDLPMVKWEDSEPWLIEDLKKLEVVDSYE